MTQHDRTTARYLRVVPDPDVPDPDETPQEQERAEALTPTRVYPAGTAPRTRVDLGALTERLRDAVATSAYDARAGWLAYWDVAMGYVMDPHLRDELVAEAEAELDRRRAAAQRRLRRAYRGEDRQAAQRALERAQRRQVSEYEVDARVLAARSGRLLRRLVVPAAVVVCPVWLASTGVWPALLVWPAAWVWLAIQGRAQARVTATAAEVPRRPLTPGAPTPPAEAPPLTQPLAHAPADLAWHPGRTGLGVDSATGEVVPVPQGRVLVAGTSGAGKSTLIRVMISDALTRGQAVVYIDAKGEDAALWESRGVRVAIEPEAITRVVAELMAEHAERGELNRAARRAHWVATPDRPQILVVVDEGAEVIGLESRQTPMLAGLVTLARTGRARGLDVAWCTQAPTVGDGIPRQLKSVLTGARIALRTATDVETRTVLGSDATQAGWDAHLLPRPGLALIRDGVRGPVPVAVWDLAEHMVQAMPPRPAWARDLGADDEEWEEEGGAGGVPDALAVALDLSQGQPGVRLETVAQHLRTDALEAQSALAQAGVRASRYSQDGRQVRGYRRADLEAAAARYGYSP